MTALQAITRLIRHFSPEEQTLPASSGSYPGRVEDCLDALNDAFTELVELSPAFLRQDVRGRAVVAPVTVSLAVVAGSTAATIVAASYAAWMPGCTVLVNGSAIDNQILEAAVSGGNYILTLRYPHDGPTGAASATIYNDCHTLAGAEVELIAPLELLGTGELSQVAGPRATDILTDPEFDYGHRPRRTRVSSNARRSTIIGQPAVFWFEHHVPTTATAEMLRRFRIFPLPLVSGTLSYEARIAQPVFTAADATVIPLSERHASSILLPLAKFRLKSSGFFIHGAHDAVIDTAYATAVEMARQANPRPRTGPVLRPQS